MRSMRSVALVGGSRTGRAEPRRAALRHLAESLDPSHFDVLSTDLFDTVLLRDHTVEGERLARGAHRAAAVLGVDPDTVVRLRWTLHDAAYQAVAMERAEGDARLSAICHTMARALGFTDATDVVRAADVLRAAEVAVDIEHLRPHRSLLHVFDRAARAGIRVIAVSDTQYSERDLVRILDDVVGPSAIDAIYSSADLGLTKHAGGIFDEVVRREDVPASRFVHVGDNVDADVTRARSAAWHAVHLPRERRHRTSKLAGKVLALPLAMRRAR